AHDLAILGHSSSDSNVIITIFNAGKEGVAKASVVILGADTISAGLGGPLASRETAHVIIAIPNDFYGSRKLTAIVQDSLDMNPANDTIQFVFTYPVPPDSAIVNEILYQPVVGSCEWIEIR